MNRALLLHFGLLVCVLYAHLEAVEGCKTGLLPTKKSLKDKGVFRNRSISRSISEVDTNRAATTTEMCVQDVSAIFDAYDNCVDAGQCEEQYVVCDGPYDQVMAGEAAINKY